MEPTFSLLDREGQRMATLLTANPELAAGATPFRSVRRDTSSAGTQVSDQVRQFMP